MKTVWALLTFYLMVQGNLIATEEVLAVSPCLDLPDGSYPTGWCSPEYYVCTSGIQEAEVCDESVFDPQSGSCVPEYESPSCNSDDVTDTTDNPFSCTTDGNFTMTECSEYYYTCINGSLFPGRCPEGEIFAETTGSCVALESVPSCITTATTFTGPFVCTEDGFYSMGPCMNTYYDCVGGVIYIQTCPGNGVFYQGICTTPDKVDECQPFSTV